MTPENWKFSVNDSKVYEDGYDLLVQPDPWEVFNIIYPNDLILFWYPLFWWVSATSTGVAYYQKFHTTFSGGTSYA